MERDEHIYAYVMDELENDIKDEALWIKAYVISEGDSQKQKSIYIKYMVEIIKEKFKQNNLDYQNLSTDAIGVYLSYNFAKDTWINILIKWAKDNSIKSDVLPNNKMELSELEYLNIDFAFIKPLEIPTELFKLTKLTSLILQRMVTISEIPKEIGNLINLKKLSISGINKKLTMIPKEIGNLINLKELDLSGMHYLNEIPLEIFSLKELEKLDLRYCGALKKIPKEIENLIKLQSLSLSSDTIITIPKEIGNLSNLHHLSIRNCLNLKSIPDEITNLTQLKELSISNCPFITKLPQNLNLDEKIINNLNKEIELNIYNLDAPQWMISLFAWADKNDISKNESSGHSRHHEEYYYYGIERTREKLEKQNLLFLNSSIIGHLPDDICNLTNLVGFGLNSLCLNTEGGMKPRNSIWIKNYNNNILYDSKYISNVTCLPANIISLNKLRYLDIRSNKEITLTNKQLQWINELKKNGCKIDK